MLGVYGDVFIILQEHLCCLEREKAIFRNILHFYRLRFKQERNLLPELHSRDTLTRVESFLMCGEGSEEVEGKAAR